MNALCILAVMTTIPSSAFAQAAIAGSVKDGSGAALPGVRVETTSPALIEKARLSVTDGAGHYRIENLRPGTYAIGFTLNGWKAYQRDGIESYSPAFVPGGMWPQPLTIMTPRLIKVTGEVDF